MGGAETGAGMGAEGSVEGGVVQGLEKGTGTDAIIGLEDSAGR